MELINAREQERGRVREKKKGRDREIRRSEECQGTDKRERRTECCVVYICFKTVQILSSHPDVDFF